MSPATLSLRRMAAACSFFALTVIGFAVVGAQTDRTRFRPDETLVYKRVGDVELKVHVFRPKAEESREPRPAVVFFFGGGWRGGTPAQFYPQCYYFARRGMVAMAAEYRVYSRHRAKVVDCVADARSAVRWIRKNAARLGVLPDRIVAGGGSAGGHLAAAVATLPDFDDPTDDLSISPVPNALILFNPALDLRPKGFRERFDERRYAQLKARLGASPDQLSPLCHVRPGLPPCIIFHGKADATVPYRQPEEFCKKMREAGNRCELVGYEGAGHGFFNYGRNGNRYFLDTLRKADRFLSSLGFLEGPPDVEEVFGSD